MLLRRPFAMLGTGILSPFVAPIPATAEAQPNDEPDEPDEPEEIILGPVFEGVVLMIIQGSEDRTEVTAYGHIRCRWVDSNWMFGLEPDLKEKLNEGLRREARVLETANLPAFELV